MTRRDALSALADLAAADIISFAVDSNADVDPLLEFLNETRYAIADQNYADAYFALDAFDDAVHRSR